MYCDQWLFDVWDALNRSGGWWVGWLDVLGGLILPTWSMSRIAILGEVKSGGCTVISCYLMCGRAGDFRRIVGRLFSLLTDFILPKWSLKDIAIQRWRWRVGDEL